MNEIDKSIVGNLHNHHEELKTQYELFKSQRYSIDMTRGKPGPEQLDLSLDLFTVLNKDDYRGLDGTDYRNYGILDGIPEAKALFSEMLKVGEDEIIVAGNSSLTLMYDTIIKGMVKGLSENHPAWLSTKEIKFLCPSPGYDRHFAICENLGIKMIPVEMNSQGPDMDVIEQLVSEDSSIKGIWCVPQYSNPTGIIYSDTVVQRLAHMPAKAEDFRIFWDNAYIVHHLTETPAVPVMNIMEACAKAGNPDRPYIFSSTSKITFPGAGVSMVASSKRNIRHLKTLISFQAIGPDKLNQLRHVRFFKTVENIHLHMKKHATILKPKFDTVLSTLERHLGEKRVARWSSPDGGYFISIDTPKRCAKRTVQLAMDAGVKFTPAGATYPYGNDPEDRNIRIAPSMTPLKDIESAIHLLSLCIQLAFIES